MTKSRTALSAVALLVAFWPRPAWAQPPATPTADEMVATYNRQIREAMGPVDGARRCPRGDDDAIVVCGRGGDARMRLPLGSQPEEGRRNRLIAGEADSGRGALGVGRACCEHGGGIDLIGAAGALARGADRI